MKAIANTIENAAENATANVTANATGFSASWLQQREPFDAAARDAAAPRLGLQTQLAALRPDRAEPWRIIDLACGTGANLRWLAPRLGGQQQWLVVDHDPDLLSQWPRHLAMAQADEPSALQGNAVSPPAPPPAVRPTPPGTARPRAGGDVLHHTGPGFAAAIVRQQLDLAASLHGVPWSSAHLVTASALLDLVSAAWLRQLVHHAAAARVALLMALSVDGRHQWSRPASGDNTAAALFAAHQRRDKGFAGPALGAAATPALARLLRAAGYRVVTARSDWVLNGQTDAPALALQQALVDGMATAACEQQPAAAAAVQAWQQRRHALAARSTLRVGHVDLLALPAR